MIGLLQLLRIACDTLHPLHPWRCCWRRARHNIDDKRDEKRDNKRDDVDIDAVVNSGPCPSTLFFLSPGMMRDHRELEPERQAAAHIAAGRLDEALVALEAIDNPRGFSKWDKRDVRDALVLVKAGDLEQAKIVLDCKSTPLNDVADALRLHMFREADNTDRELAALIGFGFFPGDDDLQAHIKAVVDDVGTAAIAARLRRIAARLDAELPLIMSPHGPLARSLAEQVLGDDGDQQIGIAAAREAVDRDRNDVTVWTNLWYSLPDDMPPRERDELGHDALRRFADDPDALDELDIAFYQHDELKKAVEQRLDALAHKTSARARGPSSPSSTATQASPPIGWAVVVVVSAALWWVFGR